MVGRRKGEQALPKVIRPFDAEHPVWRMIQDGDGWLNAWLAQMCTPWATISRKTKISIERIMELDDGEVPTEAEIEALSNLWHVTPDGLRKSIEEANKYLIKLD